jgi:hypothetical protein
MSEQYLGDGLFCSIDCGMVKLRAPRLEGDHVVYLEHPVLIEFLNWLVDNELLKKELVPASR